jgi:hypothetical protein
VTTVAWWNEGRNRAKRRSGRSVQRYPLRFAGKAHGGMELWASIADLGLVDGTLHVWRWDDWTGSVYRATIAS